MGAEFLLYAVPRCAMHSERVEKLRQCLNNTPEDDLRESLCDEEDPRARLRQALDFLAEMPPGRRDSTEFYMPGMPYRLWMTGGLSSGDFPTDAAPELAVIADCPPLYRLLEGFAAEDLQSSLPLHVDSPTPGEPT